jgi:hypothetical protein
VKPCSPVQKNGIHLCLETLLLQFSLLLASGKRIWQVGRGCVTDVCKVREGVSVRLCLMTSLCARIIVAHLSWLFSPMTHTSILPHMLASALT